MKLQSGSYASTKKLHSLCGHKSHVSQAAFFPDSSKLISLSDASGFKIYDFNSADWQRDDTPRGQFRQRATLVGVHSINYQFFEYLTSQEFISFRKLFPRKNS